MDVDWLIMWVNLRGGYASHVSASRPRQNSVFVGASTSHYLMPRPPRKTRSAMDLHSMVLDESAEQV
uniref:HDC17784 n=1 Tax=Drosophila melanogaster TaxID=7227 RepID=Q6IIK6_DROME|nr:TPA_inf: HDC17784 [Drosophila melanogaster]